MASRTSLEMTRDLPSGKVPRNLLMGVDYLQDAISNCEAIVKILEEDHNHIPWWQRLMPRRRGKVPRVPRIKIESHSQRWINTIPNGMGIK